MTSWTLKPPRIAIIFRFDDRFRSLISGSKNYPAA